MLENYIEFEVFPLVFNKMKFSYAKFYVNILQSEPDEMDKDLLEPAEKIEELNIRLRRKEFRKRILGRMDFKLTGGNILGIKMFSLFRKFKKPTALTLHAEKDVKLTRLTKYKCKTTGEEIQPEFMGKYFPLGDEKVIFNNDELQMMKNLTGQEFTLIGFKPKSSLKVYHNTGPSVFVVSDDERVTNSSKAFDALIKEMSKKDKIAIVKVKMRDASSMRFCALIPQEERKDKDNSLIPCGFHLITMPFSDEIRKLESFYPSEEAEPTENELECAINLINSMTVSDFDPKTFENPDIQNFYSVLQALALKEEIPTEIVDYIQPDIDGMQEKIEVFNAFNECFFPLGKTHGKVMDGFDNYEAEQEKKKPNRLVGKANVKEENIEEKINELIQMVREKNLKALKIADLEFIIKNKGFKINAKLPKKDLIDEIGKLV
jgi:ATP-dependent DNA helicase 2 subunit 1